MMMSMLVSDSETITTCSGSGGGGDGGNGGDGGGEKGVGVCGVFTYEVAETKVMKVVTPMPPPPEAYLAPFGVPPPRARELDLGEFLREGRKLARRETFPLKRKTRPKRGAWQRPSSRENSSRESSAERSRPGSRESSVEPPPRRTSRLRAAGNAVRSFGRRGRPPARKGSK